MSRCRGICFTINNYTEEDETRVGQIINMTDYGICGKEIAPKTGTPHLQGYCYFKNKISFSTLKDLLPKAHFEAARGTATDNKIYCSKEKIFVEHGEIPTQGKRTDIEGFRDAILEGTDEETLLMTFPHEMAKYDRFYQRCRNIVLKKEAQKMIQPEVIVITGETGIGKTRTVYETHDVMDIYKVEVGDGSSGSIFWDNYNGESVILIDDFHNNFKLDYMLRLLDRYPMKLNIKGGHTWKCAKKIYITSNLHPTEWYPYCPNVHRKALWRRITKTLQLEPEHKI